MSMQDSLTDDEKQIVRMILDKHSIDYEDNEVSINVSGYDEDEESYIENIYIQVN